MQLNTLIADLNKSLPEGKDLLVDGGYLEPAIKVMYEYYTSAPDERSQKVFEYFTMHTEFKFLTFLKAYIKDVTGFDVNLDYTNDDWLRISID